MPRANDLVIEERASAPQAFERNVSATRIIVSTLGLLLAVGGLDHGMFEILQGNQPTGGLFVHAIGPRQQMWAQGTEDAFTLLPTFLLSGVASIALSVLIAVWSAAFVQRRQGSSVLLALCILLFLSGGGVAQILFFTLAWAVSLRMEKPVLWVGRLLPERLQRPMGRLWSVLLAVFVVIASMALAIAITGYVPGVHEPLRVLHMDWGLLAIALGVLLACIAAGFLHDAERRPSLG